MVSHVERLKGSVQGGFNSAKAGVQTLRADVAANGLKETAKTAFNNAPKSAKWGMIGAGAMAVGLVGHVACAHIKGKRAQAVELQKAQSAQQSQNMGL